MIISLQVRSLTLDVKVWEPSVIALFQSLGNTFANSVWEESLQARGAFHVNVSAARLVSCSTHFLSEVHLHLSDIIWPLETEAHTDLINSTSSISASQVMLIPFQPRRNSSMQRSTIIPCNCLKNEFNVFPSVRFVEETSLVV